MALVNGDADLRGDTHGGFALPDTEASELAQLGLLLSSVGFGGLGLYVLWYLPTVITIFLGCALAGGALLAQELRVGDRILGVSPSRILAAWLRYHVEACSRFALLMSVPEVSPEDVEVVIRDFCASSASFQEQTVPSGSCRRKKAPRALEAASSAAGATEDEVADFEAAVLWLQRPSLSMGLRDQIRMRGIYLQAVAGDWDATGRTTAGGGAVRGVLARLQQKCWRELKGVSREAARTQLAPALAEVDARFAVDRPWLVVLPGARARRGASSGFGHFSSMMAVALLLLERRLPKDLDERIARAQWRLFGATAAATLSAVVATLRDARALRSAVASGRSTGSLGFSLVQRCTRRFAGLGSICSLYLLLLARGLPAWFHARILAAISGKTVSDAGTATPGQRLFRILLKAVLPRVATPLLAGDEAHFPRHAEAAPQAAAQADVIDGVGSPTASEAAAEQAELHSLSEAAGEIAEVPSMSESLAEAGEVAEVAEVVEASQTVEFARVPEATDAAEEPAEVADVAEMTVVAAEQQMPQAACELAPSVRRRCLPDTDASTELHG